VTDPLASLSPEMRGQAMDLMALQAEELDPELARWVEDGPIGPMVKHPLVYDIAGVNIPGLPNRQLARKKAHLVRAREAGDWDTVVFLHERPWRADALFELVEEFGDRISDADYWRLVGRVWVDSENIWENTDAWTYLLGAQRRHRLAIMGGDDTLDATNRAMYDALPENVVVYRGCQQALNEEGLSWTTDKAKARWFARRFHERRDGPPIVLVGTVAKADVIACFTDRGESEVVVAEGSVDVQRIEDV